MSESIEPFRCMYCHNETKTDFNSVFTFCPFCGKKQSLIKEPSLDNEIENKVYDWLAEKLNIDTWLMSETIKNQMATVFLLIWPIIESKLFNNDMSHDNMILLGEKYADVIKESDLDPIAEHFYLRYQNNETYDKLINHQSKHDWGKIRNILSRKYTTIYKSNKIIFMIFVVYRYRNNIFHGSKKLETWNDFSKEIQLCIEFMMLLGDCINDENKINKYHI